MINQKNKERAGKKLGRSIVIAGSERKLKFVELFVN